MVGQRELVEGARTDALVVNLHIVVDSLLVAQVEVVLLMIRRDHVMARLILLFLLFFFFNVLSLTAHVRARTNFLKRFASA